MREVALSSLLIAAMAIGQATTSVGKPVKDSGQTNASASIFIPVLMNDPSGSQLLSVTSGRATIQEGQIFYTPGGFVGNDTFSYTTQGGSATVTVAVTPAPPTPTGGGPPVNDLITTQRNTPIDIRVLDNDPVGSLLIGINNPPQALPSVMRGTAVTFGSQIRYTPPDGFQGDDVFRYQTQSGTAQVTVRVVSSLGVARDTARVFLRNTTNTPVTFRLTTSPGIFVDPIDPTQVYGFVNVGGIVALEPFTEVEMLVEINQNGQTVGFQAFAQSGVFANFRANGNVDLSTTVDTAVIFFIDNVFGNLTPALNFVSPPP